MEERLGLGLSKVKRIHGPEGKSLSRVSLSRVGCTHRTYVEPGSLTPPPASP